MESQSALSVRTLTRGSLTYVRLYGAIDESFVANNTFGEITGGDVILNLKGVTRISSFGVREWVNAVQELVARVDRVSLVECSPIVVSQLSMIANFSAGANVVSVQAPYFCEQCSWDTSVSVTVQPGMAEQAQATQVECQRCKNPMEMDDDPERYFAFAQDVSDASLSPDVLEFMKSFEEAGDAPADAAPNEPPTEAAAVAAPEAAATPAAAPATAAASTPVWRRPVALAAVAVALVAVVIVVVLWRSPTPADEPGASAEPAAPAEPAVTTEKLKGRLDRLITDGDLAAAEALLKKHETLPAAVREEYDRKVTAAKKTRAEELANEARKHLKAKRYLTAARTAGQAATLHSLDGDMAFLLAEALRLGGDLTAAIQHYERLTEEFPDHPSVDAAIYWQAEHLALTGQRAEARALFRKVGFEMPKSNYKKAARRRFRNLK